MSLIIMITRLVENDRRKAHHYWPEKGGQDMNLDNEIKIKYEDEEFSDGIHKRRFTVTGRGECIIFFFLKTFNVSKANRKRLSNSSALTGQIWKHQKTPKPSLTCLINLRKLCLTTRALCWYIAVPGLVGLALSLGFTSLSRTIRIR